MARGHCGGDRGVVLVFCYGLLLHDGMVQHNVANRNEGAGQARIEQLTQYRIAQPL